MKKILVLLVVAAATSGASAQQLWTSAELKIPVTKKITAEVEAEYRTTDRFSSIERWTVNASVAYHLKSCLKFDAGYKYINSYQDDEFSTKMTDITESPQTPYCYYYTPGYQLRSHRACISATGSVKSGNLSISLCERYQFTHRIGKNYKRYYINSSLPSQDFTKEDFMTSGTLQECTKETQNKHSLRSRVEAEYTFSKKCRFKPYASIEMYNTLNDKFSSDKTRYTAGCSYKINPHNSIDLFYRFVREYDGSTNINVIGVGYCFKL